VWYLWYPLLAFTIIFVGRAWCFMCPVGGIGEWVHRTFSFNKKYPQKYQNIWIAIALFLFISATEKHFFGFTRSPFNTAYLLLFFVLLSILLGIFSMFAGTELRCKSRKICKNHKIKECIVGNGRGHPCPMFEFPQTMDRNNFCIYCTECIKTCSKNNIRISPRMFGTDIIKSKKIFFAEAFLIHSIIVLILFKLGMEKTSFRNIVIDFVLSIGIDRNIMAVIIFVLLSAYAVALMYLLCKITIKDNAKKHFIKFSYAFIPIGLAIYLADSIFRVVRGILYIISKIGRDEVNIVVFLNMETINTIQILFILIGFISSVWIGYQLSIKTSAQSNRFLHLTPLLFMMAIYTLIGLKILTLPVL